MPSPLSSGVVWVVLQFVVLALETATPMFLPASVPSGAALFGVFLIVLAVGLAVWASRTLGASLTPLPRPRAEAVLVTSGPYRWVRHPIYSAFLLASLGWAWIWTSWVIVGLSAALWLVFVFKTRLEERWLLLRYPDYEAYRTRTGALVPRLLRR